MELFDVIAARHSYRGAYLPEPVPHSDLQRIMEAGLAAPSGCNKQTTLLTAVETPELIDKIFEIMELPFCQTAPALICVTTKRIIAYKDGWGRERSYQVQDYAAAIENMLLAITALGYASCWIEGHITDADEQDKQIAALLEIPADERAVCILPVGRPADAMNAVKKQPFSARARFR
ncbi:MAG: nitroreductase family protein [Oscillospiraceae bacterium]|nr:nitroreductase family protein [Oscillospiraceae bacterium]